MLSSPLKRRSDHRTVLLEVLRRCDGTRLENITFVLVITHGPKRKMNPREIFTLALTSLQIARLQRSFLTISCNNIEPSFLPFSLFAYSSIVKQWWRTQNSTPHSKLSPPAAINEVESQQHKPTNAMAALTNRDDF